MGYNIEPLDSIINDDGFLVVFITGSQEKREFILGHHPAYFIHAFVHSFRRPLSHNQCVEILCDFAGCLHAVGLCSVPVFKDCQFHYFKIPSLVENTQELFMGIVSINICIDFISLVQFIFGFLSIKTRWLRNQYLPVRG